MSTRIFAYETQHTVKHDGVLGMELYVFYKKNVFIFFLKNIRVILRILDQNLKPNFEFEN
jgi:hypothetical protein